MEQLNTSQELPELTREQLEQLSKDKLIDIVLLLQEQNKTLRERVRILESRVAELERRLGMNSQNSSKPPSSDPPWKKSLQMKRPKSGKKPGGQPGHDPHFRELLPQDQVDHLEIVKPGYCSKCGHVFSGEDLTPQRLQWMEIPKIKPTVHEVQLHSLICPCCGTKSIPAVPAGTPTGAFGPRLQALVATLSGTFRMGKRGIVQLLGDLFSVQICLGSVSKCEEEVSKALEAPVAEVGLEIQKAQSANLDETGWKQKSRKFWLWVSATTSLAFFVLRANRSSEVAKELLGKFCGILTTDRFGAYGFFKGFRQWCWAHLLRDFTGMSECTKEVGQIGKRLLRCTKKMFKWWHWVRDGTWSREKFQQRMKKLRVEIENLLVDGENCHQKGVSGFCKRLLKNRQYLWTFVDHEGIEPTNNLAERILRHAVMWRKMCLGTQSEKGSRFVERMLSTTATCKLQGRNVLEFATQACIARLNNLPPPSLLPTSC